MTAVVPTAAPARARGLSFKSSVAPMGSKCQAAVFAPSQARKAQRGALKVVAGNDYENGLFAPAVKLVRPIIGVKRFNQIRGKAIALHSQVITEFCKEIGADGKVRQNLIRTAKKNGGLLGFLA